MTSFMSSSARILRYSTKKSSIQFVKTNLQASYATQPSFNVTQLVQIFSPRYRLNSKDVCTLCGTVSPAIRTLSTSQMFNGTYKQRPPIVFNKKGKAKVVSIWKNMTVRDLATTLEKTVDKIYEVFLYIDGTEDYDSPDSAITDLTVLKKAAKICGKKFVIKSPDVPKAEIENNDAFKSPPAPPQEMEPRPPIVTIMGHVDHGKTTLLDHLRKSSIVETEFGGITQHIGAFEVLLENGQQVTFLDTPGHAAFSAMRARGANVTDMIVLVVAAEDGALQQTKESADLAREANTPLVVAINKIDKPEADIRKCEESLITIGIQPESMGGDVQVVPISALKGTNVPLLVEALVTQAELLELKATKKGLSEGTVIESELHSGRGKIATCIIQRGTLRKGSFIVAETAWAKVRGLFNSQGKPVEKALPGTPVQVIGWKNKIPPAGSELLEVDGERRAKEVVSFREDLLRKKKEEKDFEEIQEKLEQHLKVYREQREKKLQMGIRHKLIRNRPPLEKLYKDDPRPRLSMVLKGDVDGSVDAILDVLDTYHSDECPLDLLSYGVGAVTPNEIDLAKLFNGIVYTFNLPITMDIKNWAVKNAVEIRQHNIIYRMIEDLQDEISKRLPLVPKEEVIGEAIVQQEFMVSEGKKKVPVAGCRCVSGVLKKSESFRVIRSSDKLHEGDVLSMKHLKKELESIKKDVECGIMFKDHAFRLQPGDKILCYRMNMVKQTTDWNPSGF